MAKKGLPRIPVTKARKQAFLRAYKESGGNFSEACRRIAAGHTQREVDQLENPPAYSTFRLALRQDLEFAEAFEQAKQDVKDALVEILHKRAVEGTSNYVYQKGQQIWQPKLDAEGAPVRDANGEPILEPATTTTHDPRWLLSRLRQLAPDEFGDRKDVNINIRDARAAAWTISAQDLHCLSDDEARQLSQIIHKIRVSRGDHSPAPKLEAREDIEDAEFTEVEPETVIGEDGKEYPAW